MHRQTKWLWVNSKMVELRDVDFEEEEGVKKISSESRKTHKSLVHRRISLKKKKKKKKKRHQ